jgi:hypothetical protein
LLVEEYFLLPTDEGEVETWDKLDEQGAEFERGMDSRQSTTMTARQAGKAKKAFKYIPLAVLKKRRRKRRDDEFLGQQ